MSSINPQAILALLPTMLEEWQKMSANVRDLRARVEELEVVIESIQSEIAPEPADPITTMITNLLQGAIDNNVNAKKSGPATADLAAALKLAAENNNQD